MNVAPYAPAMLPALTQLINRHITAIPPHWVLAESQVVETLVMPSPWKMHYPGEAQSLTSEVLCVVEGKHLVAAAQWVFPEKAQCKNDDDRCMGQIFWLLADSDSPVALAMLLDGITERARTAQHHAVCSSRFAFGVGWPGVSNVWPHLTTGLLRAGYERTRVWVLLTGKITDDSLSSTLPDGITLHQRENSVAAEWALDARLDENLVGECHAWGIPRQFQSCRGYNEWITIEWLGVEPLYQGRRIGRFLLQEQLRFQARRGIKFAAAWVEPENEAALRVCHSFGLTKSYECWEYKKLLF